MLFRLAAIVLTTAALLPSASAPGRSPPAGPEVTLDELAERHVRAMEALPYLKMYVTVSEVADVTQDDGTQKRFESSTRLVTEMADGRLRTDVFKPDGTLEVSILLSDGRMSEYRPTFDFGEDHRLNNAVLSYDAPYNYGTEDIYLKPPEHCLYGSYLNTWLGPDSRMAAQVLGPKIARSESFEEIKVDGKPAYRFTRKREYVGPGNETEVLTEYLTIDAQSMLAISLVGEQRGPQATIVRTRMFRVLEAGPLPTETRWTINTAEDGKLTLNSLLPEGKEVAHDVEHE